MDYNTLMDLAVDLGYELSVSGAETFRIEDSIRRIWASYGIHAEVFAIPNCLIVSILTETGKPISRMRRIGDHGNNLDAVEKLNALSRRICAQKPEPKEAMKWLENVRGCVSRYGLGAYLLGNFLGAAGFSVLFGCNGWDIFLSGICGIFGGIANHYMERMQINPFFMTITSAFFMAFAAYGLNYYGIAQCVDAVIIGALMILVPGTLFTSAMRDIIYGDINSGVVRLVQVVLIAFAMALGTAVAWNAAAVIWQEPISTAAQSHPLLLTCVGAVVGSTGFAILFNIHGPGGILCALGGAVSWIIYSFVVRNSGNPMLAYFAGAVFASAYAEIMARVRKYPAISYLVVSLFPLIPGSGLYNTTNYAVHGQMQEFAAQGMYTAAIAGMIAVGVLMISTIVRFCYTWRELHPIK